MFVNLHKFVGQKVHVTYRNGITSYTNVERTAHDNYPYRVGGLVYTPCGRYYKDSNDPRDIISIDPVEICENIKSKQEPDFRAICEELVKVGTDYILDDREVVEFDQALIKARKALQETTPRTLVEQVGKAIASTCKEGDGYVILWEDAAKAAIWAVAEWLQTDGASHAYCGSIAAKLELECQKK